MGRPKPLSEHEWEACTYPGTLLPHLRKASARKLRLFVCACCRRIWNLLFDERSKCVIDAAEAWADGRLSATALKTIQLAGCLADKPTAFDRTQLNRVTIPKEYRDDGRHYYAARAARSAGILRKSFVVNTAWAAANASLYQEEEQREQAILIREIFGNPFLPQSFSPAWRTEHTTGIAAKMYDDRDFAAMSILADALEEAGCDSAEMLSHCREPGVHVRGCWAVDLVLGKA